MLGSVDRAPRHGESFWRMFEASRASSGRDEAAMIGGANHSPSAEESACSSADPSIVVLVASLGASRTLARLVRLGIVIALACHVVRRSARDARSA